MHFYRIVLSLVFLNIVQLSFSQSADELWQFLYKTYLPVETGAHPQTLTIIETNDGILYFGNGSGISEFYGNNNLVLKLPKKSTALKFAKDSAGTIYAGGINEFGIIGRAHNGKSIFRPLDVALPNKFKEFGTIYNILVGKNSVWFVAQNYIFEYTKREIRTIKSYSKIINSTLYNNLPLVTCANNKILLLTDNTLTEIKNDSISLTAKFQFAQFHNFKGANPPSFKTLTELDKQYKALANPKFPAYNTIRNVKCLNENLFIITTVNEGAVALDKNLNLIAQFGTQHGLDNNTVNDALVDNEGNLWLCTNSSVERLLLDKSILRLKLPLESKNNIEDLFFTKETTYIAGHNGLFELKDNQISKLNNFNTRAWCIEEITNPITNQKIIVSGTDHGISMVQNSVLTSLYYAENSVFSIKQSQLYPNFIFIATNTGIEILKWVDNKPELFYAAPQTQSYNVRSIEIDNKGVLWAGSYRSGIFRLNPDAKSGLPTLFESFKEVKALGERRNLMVHSINDQVVFSTEKGIMLYNEIYNISVVDNTIILAGLNKATDPILAFKINYGGLTNLNYPFNAFQYGFFLAAKYNKSDESVWLGGSEGIHRFTQAGKQATKVPELCIFSLKFSDSLLYFANKRINTHSSESNETKWLGVQTNQLPLIINASLLSHYNTELNKYAYRIISDDTLSFEYSKKSEISINNLSSGKYRIEIYGKNALGTESKPLIVNLRILPAWYQTWWFYLSCTLLLLLLLRIAFTHYNKRITRQNRKLELIVKLRTRKIQLQNVELSQKTQDLNHAIDELKKLSIVADNTGNMVVVFDKKGEFQWVNKSFTKILQYNFTDLAQTGIKTIFDLFGEEESTYKITNCIKNLESVAWELPILKKNNRKLWVHTALSPVVNEMGTLINLVMIITDISDLKEAEMQLLQKNEEIALQAHALETSNHELEKLSLALRETDNAVFIMNAEGYIEWVNEGFTGIYGYTLNEFAAKFGRNLFEVSTNPEIRAVYKKIVEDHETVIYESYIMSSQGEKIWVQTTITPIKDLDGNVSNLIAIDSDIRKLKKAEHEIQEKSLQIFNQKEVLELQNEEILTQRDRLKEQKDEVERRNRHINAGLRYARTIQKAFLPDKKQMQEAMDFFLIFRPKEIVSGDFYWFSPIRNTVDDIESYIVAVVDCTGHGVPGAFMSMLGSRLLNEIVNDRKVTNPSTILELLDEGINNQLKQQITENNDGMDVALCFIKPTADGTTQIIFSGAKRPIYIYRSENDAIEVLKGVRRPIGGTQFIEYKINFVNQEFIVKKGDMLYLLTDGFVDQLTMKGKKFGTKQFLQMLKQTAAEPVEVQKDKLERKFNAAVGYQEQIDDITLLGIRC